MYAIDVENPRVKKSMKVLGIEPEDLLKKDLDDFEQKDVSEEVQSLRFSYFTRKQQELVRQIKANIKENILKALEDKSKSLNSTTYVKYSTPEPIDPLVKLNKLKLSHQKKISMTLQDLQEKYKGDRAIEEKLKGGESLRIKLKSALLKKRDQLNAPRVKQKESIKNVSFIEKDKVRNSRKCVSVTPRASIVMKVSSENEWIEPETESDDEIQGFLEKYQEKMQRSQVKYERNIDNRRQAAIKLIQKAELTSKAVRLRKKVDINEKIAKMLLKTKAAEDRRLSHRQKQSEHTEKQRQLSLERRDKALIRFKQQEDLSHQKAKAIENRLEICQKILQQKQTNWARQLELRHEYQRLKDEESLYNAERKRKILKYRRDLVLEKQINDTIRIQVMKDEKIAEANKNFEIAMKSMIEKEKYYEVIAGLKKSPLSRIGKININVAL